MSDKVELGIFFAVMTALVVCGCVFTRKPARKPNEGQQTTKPVGP